MKTIKRGKGCVHEGVRRYRASGQMMSKAEYGPDGLMKWERVDPPLWWPAAGRYIVADRHLPDGRRQHMVQGAVSPGLVVASADVIGEEGLTGVEFASRRSHLSS